MRARLELGKESSLLAGSSATPSMDDVSALLLLFFVVECFNPFSFSVTFQPLMKEFIRLGTQFVGYRDHANKLKGILLFPLMDWSLQFLP
jgi:hypothetical protein